MNQLFALLFFSAICKLGCSQNIYVGLHLNQDREYKTTISKEIIETYTAELAGHPFTNCSIKSIDHSGVLLSEERFDEKGVKLLRLRYEYDTLTMLKSSLVFERWTRGYEKMFFFYTYDLNKCLTNIIQKDSLSNIIDHYRYVCNEKGYPASVYLIDSSGHNILKESATYLYDQNLVCISMMPLIDGNFVDTLNICDLSAYKTPKAREKFNSRGDIETFAKLSPSGFEILIEKKYEYDFYGNKIAETTYCNSPGSDGMKVCEVLKKIYIY